MTNPPLLLWYHEPSDTLAIGGESWDYLCCIKWVPFVSRYIGGSILAIDYDNPIAFVPHEIAEPRTEEWVPIGEF